jgi:3-mercaptopyruvate sulfurtransferase SseA
MKTAHWDKEIKNIVKAELVRRGMTHEDLEKQLEKIGIKTTKASIDNKLSRGTFSAVFFLQCLKAIGCRELKIDDQ